MARPLEFPDDVRPDFAGFPEAALAFLAGLEKNNDRAWFAARRETYERDVRFPMECLLAEFSPGRAPEGFPVRGDPRRGMFRIHRDVRFSKDKSPYKVHAGAVLTRTGAKSEPGLVYVHVQPGGRSFVSAGFYAPGRELLHAWRLRLAARPEEFLAVAALYPESGAYVLGHRGALKAMPRGFRERAGGPAAEYLKWKHFLVTRRIGDEQVLGRELVGAVREAGEAAAPLLRFGWDVRETALEDDPRRHMRTAGPGAP